MSMRSISFTGPNAEVSLLGEGWVYRHPLLPVNDGMGHEKRPATEPESVVPKTCRVCKQRPSRSVNHAMCHGCEYARRVQDGKRKQLRRIRLCGHLMRRKWCAHCVEADK